MNEIVAAKVRQAVSLLNEFDLPMWIVQFARETYDLRQPVTDLAVGTTVTWPSAFVVCKSGETTAIVGTGDIENVRQVGAYQNVVGYVTDVGPPLLQLIQRFEPERIGVSYSEQDEGADNITHGMYLALQQILAGTPYVDRLCSAEDVLVPLRARKVEAELNAIRQSIASTLDMFALIHNSLRLGITERALQELVHARIDSAGMVAAWDREYDPAVNFGPETSSGHAPPGLVVLEPGMLVHVDLGVKLNGYCSDLQRTWYVLRPGENRPPRDVSQAFETLRTALEAGFKALKPGTVGHEVDSVARQVLRAAGYDEPEFALGHQLGQSSHDAGALLSPQWPRYGGRPAVPIEESNVFTLEFALRTSAGTVGLEEDVVVTADGAEYLAPPQIELTCLTL